MVVSNAYMSVCQIVLRFFARHSRSSGAWGKHCERYRRMKLERLAIGLRSNIDRVVRVGGEENEGKDN